VSKLRTSIAILGAPELPLRSRLRVLTVGARLAAGRPAEITVEVAGGSIFLAADTLGLDWRVLAEVLLEDDYATDYTGATVVDIGAHKGYMSAYALARGAKIVYAYEPEERNFAYLSRAAVSFDGQLQARRAAVGAREREAELHVSDEPWAHSILETPTSGHAVESSRIRVVPLADVLAEATEPGGRVIVKIDAEGAECEIVLETAEEWWHRVNELFIELHDTSPCSPSELVDRLTGAGLRPVASDGQILHLRR
jgi:FkbM family methyltransferase